MQVYSVCRLETLLGFLLILLFSGSLCYGYDKVVEVVGTGECGDCKESNIKSSHALSGNIVFSSFVLHWSVNTELIIS